MVSCFYIADLVLDEVAPQQANLQTTKQTMRGRSQLISGIRRDCYSAGNTELFSNLQRTFMDSMEY